MAEASLPADGVCETVEYVLWLEIYSDMLSEFVLLSSIWFGATLLALLFSRDG